MNDVAISRISGNEFLYIGLRLRFGRTSLFRDFFCSHYYPKAGELVLFLEQICKVYLPFPGRYLPKIPFICSL